MISNDVISSYMENMSVSLARDFLKLITRYHRIQGSSGLLNAIKMVKEELDQMGISAKIFEIPSNTTKGFVETPVSWDVSEGFLKIKLNNKVLARLNIADHPTLIAAHSPPGEGCGKLTICDDENVCEGEVVLTELPAYIAYKNIDADLILLYDSKRYPTAVPYNGLFIHRDEITRKVVMNIPYIVALRLKSILNKRRDVDLSIEWKAKTAYSDRSLYGLLVCSGNDPGILYISHICHPKPGAHDNASGSVVNMLTFLGIERSSYRFSHCHAWVPEYTGTIFIDMYLPWKPIGVVNLDMVGSKQWITGSTLNIINTPLYMESYMPMYAYLATKMVFDNVYSFSGFRSPGYRYSLAPYTTGSDHDVTIAWGWDSVMLNEWPSKYYHTDMDEITSISPGFLVKTALVAILTGFLRMSSSNVNIVKSVFNKYLASWYIIEALKNGLDINELPRLINMPKMSRELSGLSSPIMPRMIYKALDHKLYIKLRDIKGAMTFLSLYAPLAYLNGVRENDIFEMFQLENLIKWKDEEKAMVEYAWNFVKEKFTK